MDKTKPTGGLTLTINTTINFFWGTSSPREFPVRGAWAMPHTIRNLPDQGESK